MPPAGSIVVAVLDRDSWKANTDIIVVANPKTRSLTWIPRDVWAYRFANRINRAFAVRGGGGRALMTGLKDLGFPCRGFVCLRRAASEGALADLRVTVPVEERLDFWYPLHPTRPIEEGRKQITFSPPEEVLEGERIHQWIGARVGFNRGGSDFYRLKRQQTLLKVLLAQGFDFGKALADPHLVRSSGPDAIATLATIDDSWTLGTFSDVEGASIDGKSVLLPKSVALRRHGKRVRFLHRVSLSLKRRLRRILPASAGRSP